MRFDEAPSLKTLGKPVKANSRNLGVSRPDATEKIASNRIVKKCGPYIWKKRGNQHRQFIGTVLLDPRFKRLQGGVKTRECFMMEQQSVSRANEGGVDRWPSITSGIKYFSDTFSNCLTHIRLKKLADIQNIVFHGK